MTHNVVGALGEALAEEYFTALGAQVLARNYRCDGGELDLVVLQDDELVAVEVKLRSVNDLARPEETIDRRKLRRLVLALEWFATEMDYLEHHWRIDLIAVETNDDGTLHRFEHIADIFPP